MANPVQICNEKGWLNDNQNMNQWPHSPSREFSSAGTYIVTSGTYDKVRLFHDPARLNMLHDFLLQFAEEYGWRLEAWAVLQNHYHFVGYSDQSESRLAEFTKRLHGVTSRELNRMDGIQGRKVWMGYWQTKLTNSNSYFARLKYVAQNPVRHGLVSDARDYAWCSANWFEKHADPVHIKTVESFKIDKLSVPDDF